MWRHRSQGMFCRHFPFLFYHVMWKQGIIASIWHIGCAVWPTSFGDMAYRVMSSRSSLISQFCCQRCHFSTEAFRGALFPLFAERFGLKHTCPILWRQYWGENGAYTVIVLFIIKWSYIFPNYLIVSSSYSSTTQCILMKWLLHVLFPWSTN